MSDAISWIFVIALTCNIFGWAAEMDSIPAAITVYRNPEFFKNITRGKEKKDSENSDEEEDKGDFYSNNSDEFHDFEDVYRYPGEPKKPNPGSGPDFTTYYDESPEFVPEPRDIAPSSTYMDEEEEEEQEGNELNEEEQAQKQEEELQEEGEDEDENLEEEEEEEKESKPLSEYHVPMEKSLEYREPPKLYEESRQYYNPVFKTGMKSFNYPSSFTDLDYYSHPLKERKFTDNKKGTREYLRDHSAEDIDEPKPGNARADSKHIFRTISKFGVKPVIYVPYVVPKIKSKYKISYKPKKLKWRFAREIPDDSAYQLSSDYDSDFEFL